MNDEMLFHLRSLTRVIYFVTEEEDRFLLQLSKTLEKFQRRTFVYNPAQGLMTLEQQLQDWKNKQNTQYETRNLVEALTKIYTDDPRDEQNFYIILDPEQPLSDPSAQRRILNIIHQLRSNDRNIKILIFVSSRLVIPQKLRRYIEVVHDTGLTTEEIETLVTQVHSKLPESASSSPPTATIAQHLRGLTSYEIDAVLSQSIIKTKRDPIHPRRIDPKYIAEFKRRQIRRSGLLDFVDVDQYTFDQVGGNDRFKSWAKRTAACWTPEGQAFGLTPPKGVLAVGVWGCGKSLCVKALANAWKLPVIPLETGQLRSSAVGETEHNARAATRLIEAVAPCVTGETVVTLADGSVQTIESLWQDTPERLEVMCWDDDALKVTTTTVQAVTRRVAEAFRIEAANGYQLSSTANHQHYILRGGMPEWVRTDELQPGDMWAVPLKCYDGDPDCSKLWPKGMRSYSSPEGAMQLRRGGGGYRDSCVDRLPSEWSTDLGWLLGVIEGDGYIGSKSPIGLVNSSECLLDRFELILKEQFGLKPVRRETSNSHPDLPGLSESSVFKPCWDTKATNQLVAEFLCSAREQILTAPASIRAAFLAGWIDADGCIGPSKVTLTVKCPEKGRERKVLVRRLVQSLGVVPSKFDSSNFELTGSRAVLLASKLEGYLVLKGARAREVSHSDFGFDRGMGFSCGSLLHEARSNSSIDTASLGSQGISVSVLWRHENGRTPISERYMHKYVAAFDKHARKLAQLLAAECRWVEIHSVESLGEQNVYDLSCEGERTHSFIANGIVTHNCIVWVDEAEKTLAGGQSSGQSDAGTTSRLIGILSTWLQETTAPVCLAMTANSLRTMPVEFVNRMNERFFFDLPSEEERIEILKIHLTKRGQDPAAFQLAELAEAAVNMVGREIEQAIDAALINSFEASMETLGNDILLEELVHKPRIFKTMSDELHEILEWVGYDPDIQDGVRARFASSKRSEHFRSSRS